MINAERIKELRKKLFERCFYLISHPNPYAVGPDHGVSEADDLIAALDDYERLREDYEYKNEQLGAAILRAEKAEVDLIVALAVNAKKAGIL